jgi:hypothetical protein
MNYKWVAIFILMGLALICVEGVIVSASADDSYVVVGELENLTVNTSVNVTTTPTPIPTELAVGRRIMQGECVIPGETIDIAGTGWYTGKINYYGRYYDGFTGENSSWKADYEVKSQLLDHFYLEPNFFNSHLGWWYLQEDYYDASANDRLFYVATTCNQKQEIQKAVVVALNESQKRAALVANISQLPIKTISGVNLILNKNVDKMVYVPNGSQRYWMFGTNTPSYLYDNPVVSANLIYFDKNVISSLPSETYDTIFIKPGANGIVEETYNKKTNAISSPFRDQLDTSLVGISSSVAEQFLKNQIEKSNDDNYTQWIVDIQDPAIYVAKLSQTPLTNNHSLIVLAGYTNENEGTTLKVKFDTDATNPSRTYGNEWKATVIEHGGLAAYRVWNTSFIIDFNQVFPGQHSFTVTSPNGATATIPIYRRVEQLPNYQPQSELGFFDNSPFIPTPTPIIQKVVERETVKVIETVTVTITPSEEDWNNYAIAQDRIRVTEAVIVIVVILLIGGIAWFAYSYIRSKRRLD